MPTPTYSYQLGRAQLVQNEAHYRPYTKEDNIRLEDLQQPSVQLQSRDNYANLQSMNDDLMACISNSEYTLSSIRRDMQNQAKALATKANEDLAPNTTSSPQQLSLSRGASRGVSATTPSRRHHDQADARPATRERPMSADSARSNVGTATTESSDLEDLFMLTPRSYGVLASQQPEFTSSQRAQHRGNRVINNRDLSQYYEEVDAVTAFNEGIMREKAVTIDTLERNLKTLKVELNIKDREMNAARERISELVKDIGERDAEIKNLRHKLENVKYNAERFILARDEEIARLAEELEQMDEHYQQKMKLKDSKLHAQHEELVLLNTKDDEITGLKSKLAILTEQLEHTEGTFKAIVKSKDEQIETLKADVHAKRDYSLEIQRIHESLSQVRKDCEEQLRQKDSELCKQREQADAAEKEKNLLGGEVTSLKEIIERQEDLIIKLKGQLERSNPDVERLQQELDTLRIDSQKAISAKIIEIEELKTKVHALTTEMLMLPTPEDILEARNEVFRATASMAATIKTKDAEILSLKRKLENYVELSEVQRLKGELNLSKAALADTIVQKTAEIRDLKEEMAVLQIDGHAPTATPEGRSSDDTSNDLEPSKNALDVSLGTQVEVEALRRIFEEAMLTKNNQIEALSHKLNEADAQLATCREQVAHLESALEEASRAQEHIVIDASSPSIDDLKNELQSIKDAMATTMVRNMREVAVLEHQIEQLKDENTSLKVKNNATVETVSIGIDCDLEKQPSHSSFEESYTRCCQENDRLSTELQLIAQELAQTRAAHSDAMKQLAGLNTELLITRNQASDALNTQALLESTLQEYEREVKVLRTSLDDSLQQKRETESINAKLQESLSESQLHDLQQKLEKSQADLEKLRDDYSTMQATKDMVIHKISSEVIQQRELADLAGEDVNRRLKEAEETVERLTNDLMAQKEEFVTVVTDLEQQVEKLNSELQSSRESNEALVARMMRDITSLEKERTDLESQLEAAKNTSTTIIKGLEDQVAQYEQKITESQQANMTSKSSDRQLIEALTAELFANKEKANKTISDLTDKLNELQERLNEEKEAGVITVTRLTSQNSTLTSTTSSLTKDLEAAKESLRTVTEELTGQISKIQLDAREREQMLQGKLDEITAEAEAAAMRFHEQITQKDNEIKQLTEALTESTMQLDNISTESKQTISQLINELAEARETIQFIERKNQRDMSEISSSIATFKESAVESQKQHALDLEHKDAVITQLSNELESTKQAMETANSTHQAVLEKVMKESGELMLQNNKLEDEIQKLREQYAKSNEEAQETFRDQMEAADVRIGELQAQVETLKKDLDKVTASRDALLDKISSTPTKTEPDTVKQGTADYDALLSMSQSILSKDEEITTLRSQVELMNSKLIAEEENNKRVVDHLQGAIEVMNTQYEELRSMKDSVIERLTRQVRSTSSRIPSRPDSAVSSRRGSSVVNDLDQEKKIRALTKELKEAKELFIYTVNMKNDEIERLKGQLKEKEDFIMSLSVGSALAESSVRPTEDLLEIKRGVKESTLHVEDVSWELEDLRRQNLELRTEIAALTEKQTTAFEASTPRGMADVPGSIQSDTYNAPMDNSFATLHAELKAKDATIISLQNKLTLAQEEWEAMLAQLSKQLEQTKGELKDKIDEIVNLLAVIDRLKTEYENYQASTSTELSGLRAALEEYQRNGEIDASNARIIELEAALTTAKSKFSEMLRIKNEEIEQLNIQIASKSS